MTIQGQPNYNAPEWNTTANYLQINHTGAGVVCEHIRVEEQSTALKSKRTVVAPELMALCQGRGRVEIADLTAEEQAWVAAESSLEVC